MTISIHRASDEERLSAHRNSHEVWGEGSTVDEYVARCLGSVRHNRAEWWVFTTEGEVSASLALYPLSFRYAGRPCGGFGIGSVHTRSDRRRQGHAMALIRVAMNAALARGDRFGLLFSDIEPAYYTRLRFRICPHDRFICTDLKRLVESGKRCQLEPFVGRDNMGFLVDCHQAFHHNDALAFWRDRSEWQFLIDSNDGLRFFKLRNHVDDLLGYAWVHQSESLLIPVEIVLNQPNEEHLAQVYRSLAAFALSSSLTKMTCWNRPANSVCAFFSEELRTKSIPMLWLDSGVQKADQLVDTLKIYSSGYF